MEKERHDMIDDRNNRYRSYEMDAAADPRDVLAGMNRFIVKVYGWMFMGLLLTAFAATAFASNTGLVIAFISNPILFYGAMILEVAMVFGISAGIQRLSFQAAAGLLGAYAVLNGITLSYILLAYTGESVAGAFFTTAIMFGVMSLYGYVTRTDLSRVGAMLTMALIGVLVLSLVNIFIGSSTLGWVISIVGLIVFLGLTAWDMQKLKGMYFATVHNEEMRMKMGLLGALSLYLDFINMFLMLLRIFGRGRD